VSRIYKEFSSLLGLLAKIKCGIYKEFSKLNIKKINHPIFKNRQKF